MRTTVIVAGGVLGSLARYGISRLVVTHGDFPTATLIVNVVGALIIGAFLTWSSRTKHESLLQPFVAVGILGGFTTFSALAEQVADAHSGISLVYLVTTLLTGIIAVNVGARLAEKLT